MKIEGPQCWADTWHSQRNNENKYSFLRSLHRVGDGLRDLLKVMWLTRHWAWIGNPVYFILKPSIFPLSHSAYLGAEDTTSSSRRQVWASKDALAGSLVCLMGFVSQEVQAPWCIGFVVSDDSPPWNGVLSPGPLALPGDSGSKSAVPHWQLLPRLRITLLLLPPLPSQHCFNAGEMPWA